MNDLAASPFKEPTDVARLQQFKTAVETYFETRSALSAFAAIGPDEDRFSELAKDMHVAREQVCALALQLGGHGALDRCIAVLTINSGGLH